MSNFDVVVIGSGPGGYVGAIRCAQLGFKTALIEKYDTLGGTCLNVGCIPSKALLDRSEHYFKARKEFEEHGILTGKLSVDFEKMVERKSTVVDLTVKGIDFLMKKNNITILRGVGSFETANKVNITDKDDLFLSHNFIKLLKENFLNLLGLQLLQILMKTIF